MSIEIYDNLLDQGTLKEMQDGLLSSEFPWYFNNSISYAFNQAPWLFQFTHKFYMDHNFTSPLVGLIYPLMQTIDPLAWIRIKANLGTRTPESIQGGWHQDINYQCKTAVFYVNTNNGGTLMQDSGKFIESIANRLVVFDSNLAHTGVSQTDTNVRCVINLNFIDKK